MKEVEDVERTRIAALLARGMSIREIAEETRLCADVELAADPGGQVGDTFQVLLRNLERGVGIQLQPLRRKRELRLFNGRGDQSIRDDGDVHAFANPCRNDGNATGIGILQRRRRCFKPICIYRFMNC
jgi:hypothetical protein